MLYQMRSYIKFLLTSRNQHGVHSPFVFDLITKCFYDSTKHSEYVQLLSYRTQLLQNTEKMSITDFGSGSKVFTSNQRPINAIAKTSGTRLKNAKLLFRIVRYFQPVHILELGTNLGIATQALSLGNPKAAITSIEGCETILRVTNQQFAERGLSNISTLQGVFKDQIPKLTNRQWDLIFFDGHHSKKATLAYFEMLLPKAHNDSVFIFDDIHWSKEMTEAWEIIKNHPQVTVTIDIFQWGLVFFRKEQLKEHFNIRV